ncbi:hypothetical protein CGLO_08591 [Colletotrichum gloeosporioides Cg-14]|uniref:Heterokaryon incompatibility domain-containing protein n=1 Tax=Colletotrichum gloeosporioides (strain Cg-14) TaxID=1237896 RepID=T0LJK0_COLGC|nr:hypothetical protein CGLO_08591 [Colletotrichum gloeosporioides Cg-14]
MHSMFQSLDSSRREIRLLRIVPGEWVDSIVLKLDVVSLDAKPQYQALSYVWGSEADPKTVTLQDQPFQVTSNLYNALRRLRKSRASVALWVDAVCINQKDNLERTQQVSIMNHIYENAFEVVIWLGDRLSGSQKGLNISSGTLENGPPYVANHASIGNFGRREHFDNTETEAAAAFTVLQSLGEPGHWDLKEIFAVNQEGQFVVAEIYQAAWRAFLDLMSCSWWSRMWIVQEFVLARESQVVVGNVAVPGHLITDFYQSYISHLPSGCCCHLTVSWRMTSDLWGEMMNIRRADMGLNTIRNQHRDHRAHDGSLTALLRKTLWMLRPKEATDPRDKICGVLGLFPGIGIKPDYTSDAAQFFSYATEFFMNAEQGLMYSKESQPVRQI